MTSTKIWRSDTFAYTTNLKYIEYDDLKWKTSKNMLLHYFWHVWLNFPYSSFSAVIIDYRFLPCVTFLCIFLPALDSSNEASCWTWFAATSCSFRLSFSQQKVALFSPWKKMCPTKIWDVSPERSPAMPPFQSRADGTLQVWSNPRAKHPLVGGWPTPLYGIIGVIIPTIVGVIILWWLNILLSWGYYSHWKNKIHVPNHQPEFATWKGVCTSLDRYTAEPGIRGFQLRDLGGKCNPLSDLSAGSIIINHLKSS